ncbi:MAG: hypothetical protein P4L49_00400 [Desulfosporosinus sp.]|nr:hypothetical protein [Desulfosporosinus sp.]
MPISNLAGPGIIFSSTNIKWMTAPLGKIFSGDYAAFSQTMGKLGGISFQLPIVTDGGTGNERDS